MSIQLPHLMSILSIFTRIFTIDTLQIIILTSSQSLDGELIYILIFIHDNYRFVRCLHHYFHTNVSIRGEIIMVPVPPVFFFRFI